MREIKFRGKDNYAEWQYGLPTHIGDKNTWLNYWDKYDELDEVKVKTKTLGQFVGLIDTNGKYIYDGDILKYEINGNTYYREIQWYNGGFKMINEKHDIYYELGDHAENGVLVDWEVAGNIYDNPNLLEL